MLNAGQKIGAYELVAKLREGGMATLFLARMTGPAGFSRHVAIKVIHPSLAGDEQFRQMFLDEAMLTSRVTHPNVVRVEELGVHEGAHFLTMEFVHGCSLAQLQRVLLARRRRLAPAFATRIAIEVAEGLHAAHELCDDAGRQLNVVHRDVTPENILLAYGGHVKLIDFGIAKSYGRRHRTQDGLLKGKFRYMAPEQALGKAVDRRVDLYQLGIVLWEMLTLRRLFAAERDIDLLASVQRPDVQPPSSLVDRIPPALDQVVMAALHPDPRKRPADAQTFARMLARALPAAHEVDSGALRELLLATMSEHRLNERTTYPPGVYERLEQQAQVVTEPIAGTTTRDGTVPMPLSTFEHTEPLGSDSPDALDPQTRGQARVRRGRRPVRLARFASELRTSLTRIVDAGFVGSRTYWILLGSAVGLAGALALITVVSRPAERPVPALPSHARFPRASADAAERVAALRAPSPPAAPGPEPAMQPAASVAPAAEARSDAGAAPAQPRGLASGPEEAAPRSGKSTATPLEPKPQRATGRAALIMVDETPLLTEPGF